MMAGKILVVEDEADLRALICMYLDKHGFEVHAAATGQEALQLFHSAKPDLVVLDIELPDMEGTDICRSIREISNVPLVFVTCRRDSDDIYTGLAIGADDYMTKPFDPAELVARIQGHLRKRSLFQTLGHNKNRWWRNERLEVDLLEMTVKVEGRPVPLYPKELQLLQFFIQHPNRVFAADELFDRVWGEESGSDTRTVNAHIFNLRRKIERNPEKPDLIRTVRGFGYKFSNGQ
ncbi:response regulator transcription factor [Paenibacillus sp. LHD-117]|uniref:response regulator transcription factor n=1 Tax=Paenibacillus sp. LHD-117 TaxID=3071412 RepID=UPI0027E04959|nr:response regulator transcription factor [Paenibacillus sp. LHD-117]MDQ6422011.1 response regulator transcription factor [Paenibacillus sp. LHD-117]